MKSHTSMLLLEITSFDFDNKNPPVSLNAPHDEHDDNEDGQAKKSTFIMNPQFTSADQSPEWSNRSVQIMSEFLKYAISYSKVHA